MNKVLTILTLLIATQTFAQHNKNSDNLHNDLSKKNDATKEGWTKGGLLNIGLNQAMLENWAAGGERMSLAVNGQFNGFATKLNGNKLWDNNLDLYYGLNYVASSNFVPRKLDDRIDFATRYGVQPIKWMTSSSKFKRSTRFMGLFRFQSQFSKGYNYENANWMTNPISEFLSPAFLTLALGAEYRPNENFSVFFSPLAARMTIVKAKYTDFGYAFGVEQGKTSRLEVGAYMTAKYKTVLTKNITYNTRLDLFSNYLAKDKVLANGLTRKDNPGNVDILWDNFFAMKVNKFIGAGLGFTLLYDNDQPGQMNSTKKENGIDVPAYGPLGWLQLKQVLNIGFSYKF